MLNGNGVCCLYECVVIVVDFGFDLEGVVLKDVEVVCLNGEFIVDVIVVFSC